MTTSSQNEAMDWAKNVSLNTHKPQYVLYDSELEEFETVDFTDFMTEYQRIIIAYQHGKVLRTEKY